MEAISTNTQSNGTTVGMYPERDVSMDEVMEAVKVMLRFMGQDINREGLQGTPKRVAKWLREFTQPHEINFTTFEAEEYPGQVLETNIPVYSMCEHHLLPFFGFAHVAYMPGDRIVGLSKIARAVHAISSRPQNQERITTEIAQLIEEKLNPKGVAVVIECRHMCMEMRGVKSQGVSTTTDVFTGVYKEDKVRQLFMQLIGK